MAISFCLEQKKKQQKTGGSFNIRKLSFQYENPNYKIQLGPFTVSCSEYAQAVLGQSQGRLLQ